MEFKLHYMEQGEGTPFILLHGNGENSKYFSHQMDYFAKKYRVIAVDTRGHGESSRGEEPFTLIQFVEDLKKFLDFLELKKVILLGFSDGGNIALLFTLKYPSYVEHLILNGANLNPKGIKKGVQAPIAFGFGITSFFSLFSKSAKASCELLRLMVKEPNIQPNELAAINIPTLVIVGDQDMVKQSHTEEIAQHIKNSKLVVIKGNHFIANQEPSAFNEAVEQFLNNTHSSALEKEESEITNK